MAECTSDRNSETEKQRSSLRISEKYGLRPRSLVRRLHLERNRVNPPKLEKPNKGAKARPPPLSKYRRKTANARERSRMKEINTAFESLRRILPDFCSRRVAASMTKITTLRLAVSYIQMLSHILEDNQSTDVGSLFDSIPVGLSIQGSQFSSAQDVADIQRHHHVLEANREPLSALIVSPTSSTTSSEASPTRSLGSAGDFSDIFSEETSVFEDNLNAFDDIPVLHEVVDPFALLLASEEDVLILES